MKNRRGAKMILGFGLCFALVQCSGDPSSALYTIENPPSDFSFVDADGNTVSSYSSDTVIVLKDAGGNSLFSFTASGSVDFTNVTAGLSDSKSFVHFASAADKAGITGTVTLYIPGSAGQTAVTVCPAATSLAEVSDSCDNAVVLTAASPVSNGYTWSNTGRSGTDPFLVTADIADFGTGGIGKTFYDVGGTVYHLNGTLVLQNNAGDDLTLTSSGSFAFTTEVTNGSDYAVTVKTQPTNQTCTVSGASGTVNEADVVTVSVTCGKVIFITAGNVNGNLGGVSGADATCMSDANRPDTKTYKAMLTDGSTRIACTSSNCTDAGQNVDWVMTANTTYVRSDDTIIGTTNSAGVFTSTLINSFNGGSYPFPTGLNGAWVAASGGTGSCSGWTSSSHALVTSEGLGDQTGPVNIQFRFSQFCDASFLYLACIEQ